jgi:Cu+-exporting ATPase
MSIMVGTGRGAQAGILVKNAEALETLARVDTLAIDKTGTLTEGRPRVVSFEPANADLIRMAASLEQSSEHPLAAAVLEFARGQELSKVERFGYLPGKGVIGFVDGQAAALGNAALLERLKIKVPAQSGTYLAVAGKVVATLQFADPVKPSAKAMVESLKVKGVTTVLITGDHREAAGKLAERWGSRPCTPVSFRRGNSSSWTG